VIAARRQIVRWGRLLLPLVLGMWTGRAAPAAPFTFRHDAVLGTSLELVIEADDARSAEAAETTVLAEIDRCAAIMSTYAVDSEISRWIDGGVAQDISPELAGVLRACDRWRERSGGAFHPGVALATARWREAEREGRLPDDTDLASIAATLRRAPWSWHGDRVAPVAGMPVSLDALAKGSIVDAACAAAAGVDGIRGVMVNIGGDLAVRGDLEATVEIPLELRGGTETTHVRLAGAAVATSGIGRRGFRIGGMLLPHIIDPRTARPIDGVRSASVIAATAADADALATILCVLPPAEGVSLVESHADAACLVVDAQGIVHASRGWPKEWTPARPVAFQDADAAPAGDWNGGYELAVDLEIVKAEGGRRYRRPYVAAWVEDQDGFPVKTLLLWVQAEAPGPRWIPDLKRWTKADRLRKLAEGTDLVATISEPTRMPGSHGVVWDGRDNAGVLVEPGEYTLCVEAAREHGSYQFERAKMIFGTEPFRETLGANEEIGGVTLEYRRRGAADGR